MRQQHRPGLDHDLYTTSSTPRRRIKLTLREDSRFSAEYIRGDTDASVEQVVAIMKLTALLFQQGGHRCWSQNRHRCGDVVPSRRRRAT